MIRRLTYLLLLFDNSDGLGKRSFQESLCSLTPDVAEDDDDIQAVESMIIHGALHSGIISRWFDNVRNSSICMALVLMCVL